MGTRYIQHTSLADPLCLQCSIYLNSLTISHPVPCPTPSYLKDTTNLLQEISQLGHLPPGSILVTLNVSRMASPCDTVSLQQLYMVHWESLHTNTPSKHPHFCQTLVKYMYYLCLNHDRKTEPIMWFSEVLIFAAMDTIHTF